MKLNLSEYEVWLLISGEELYPFSSHGLEFAQGSLKSVRQRSSDNFFLKADGTIFRIDQIHPLNNDLAAKAKRSIGGAYRIRVDLAPHKIDLSELKKVIVGGLRNYYAAAEPDESWAFATLPISVSETAIIEAKNAKELYSILSLPSPLDCLDLL